MLSCKRTSTAPVMTMTCGRPDLKADHSDRSHYSGRIFVQTEQRLSGMKLRRDWTVFFLRLERELEGGIRGMSKIEG